jgi:YesN/AraC family two-component response regulator
MENVIDKLIIGSKDLNVLYVEDDVSLREEVSIFLLDIFHSVDLATNGQEGLDMLAKTHYDIVITDIKMPIMDGIEMIAKINELYPHQAILVTSAHNEIGNLCKLVNLGIEDFLSKPLVGEQTFNVLLRVVKCINERKELHHYRKIIQKTNEQIREDAFKQGKCIGQKESILQTYKASQNFR